MDKDIFVTRPFLAPLAEFLPYLEEIWRSRILTNNGPFHAQLERALSDYLGVEHLSLFGNGTLALVSALQALRVSGEVITTPYSFVATAHSLLWNGIQPVFVDIDPVTMNIDASKIEAAITPRTSAILPVHCYGIPCDVSRIQSIADVYGLRVIYDAAHAFGVNFGDKSLAAQGDLSILSFHATKVYNTFEGGAIVSPDKRTKQRIDYLKNFGFADEVTVVAPGINGKMNELQAAFGILQLEKMAYVLAQRRRVADTYCELLGDVTGVSIPEPVRCGGTNGSYFPVLIEAGYRVARDELYSRLRQSGVFARRYFFPLISDMPMYKGLPSACPENLPVAQSVARKVLCLPIYPELEFGDIERIVNVIRSIR